MLTTTGCNPALTPGGTTAFTWYRPAKPGARPLNDTVASWPPMVTRTGAFVVANGEAGAGSPLAG